MNQVNHNVNEGLLELRAFFESADFRVTVQQQTLLLHFDDNQSLGLELSLHQHPEAGQRYVQFLMPISLEIPDQHFLHAAQVIADFNRTSPLGLFSISADARPYFDYQFMVPSHGACMLSLLEAVQMSYLFAGHLMEFLQRKLSEWVMPGLRPQVA